MPTITGPVTLDWRFLNGTPEYRENPQETEIHMQARVWGAEGGTLTSAEVVGDIPFNITGFHFAKRAENAMRSGFLTLMSPYEKQPSVISATRLPVSGLDAYSGHALKVELSSGRHDVIAYHGLAGQKPDTQLADVPTDTVKAGDDFSLKGVFGFVSRRKDGSLRQVFMTGGKLIRSKDFVLEAERAEYVGTVRGVDRESQWIHLTEPVLPGSEVVGSIAVIGSATRSRAYSIKRVSPDGRSLQVEGSLLLYQAKVSSVNHAKGEIGVQFLPPFLRCDPKFYDGCVATNESHSLMWKVKGISKETVGAILQVGPATERSDQFKSPLNLHADSFTDADRDGRALVYMYEIAPGDTMKITTHVSVTRNENGQTQVDANVPYRLSVPPKK